MNVWATRDNVLWMFMYFVSIYLSDLSVLFVG